MPAKVSKKQRALVIGLIALGILFTAFFGMRAFHAFRQFNGHRPPPPGRPGKVETDVEFIRNWMTVPFVAELYHVPEPAIFDALKIPPNKENREKSLRDLNREYYPDANGFVLETVKVTVKKLQLPTPDSAPTIVSPPTAPAP
ncbi:hypothetical protein ANAEL_01732 [Anaerolineales bacterium]|nr:hypothetical protein ANAEL_01732 [Anaerolineales bacterium]